MKYICEKDICSGCKACVDTCAGGAIVIEDTLKSVPFHFEKVDFELAKKSNRQLVSPTAIPQEREYFFEKLKAGKKYSYIVAGLYPKSFIKRTIKYIFYMFKK